MSDINKKNKVVVIVGPTASGKTGLGVKIAKLINGEIISADSMQIYKKLNIGTAKVTDEEKQKIEHHLIDICDIEEKFSVSQYKEECYDEIEKIYAKRKNTNYFRWYRAIYKCCSKQYEI